MLIKNIFILLVFVLFSACKTKNEAVPSSATLSGPLQVEGLILEEEAFKDNILLTGSLLAYEAVSLAAEVNGRIVLINFKEGQYVQKDQILFKVFDDEIRANLKKAEANLDFSLRDLKRKQSLREIAAISSEELDRAENAFELAKADKELLQTLLEKHTIRAPFSGKIGIREVSLGSYVTPGTTLTKLFQMDPMRIEFSVPEKYSDKLKEGVDFEFKVEGISEDYRGKIEIIDPEIDPGTRTIRVRGVVSNPGNRLKTGAFISLVLPVYDYNNAIMVPASAVTSDIRGQKVLILKDGKVKAAFVETGSRTENKVLIEKGLNKGDTLITAGLLQLKEGTSAVLKNKNTMD
jgi:membrane fusion protein (multidrug efflux system)